MKITKEGFAVLENDLASRWVEEGHDLVHEPTVRAEICPLLKPGDVVVDAGAFLGGHTKAYLDAVWPSGRVLAFEPNPLSFRCLSHNCPTAELFQCGLGEQCLFAEGSDDPFNHGAHYLKASHFDGQPGPGKIEVITLDSFKLERLNFMKIDVEGWESYVILGAMQTIKRCRPILYLELNEGALARASLHNSRSLVRLMESLNYRLQFLDPGHTLDTIEGVDHINVFFFPL